MRLLGTVPPTVIILAKFGCPTPPRGGKKPGGEFSQYPRNETKLVATERELLSFADRELYSCRALHVPLSPPPFYWCAAVESTELYGIQTQRPSP